MSKLLLSTLPAIVLVIILGASLQAQDEIMIGTEWGPEHMLEGFIEDFTRFSSSLVAPFNAI